MTDVKNFYLFYGKDEPVLEREVNSLKESLHINPTDVITYPISSVEDIIEEALTISMFSPSKFIIIDATSYLSDKKDVPSIALIEDYFEHYNQSSYLVFISNKDTVDSRKKLYKLLSSKGQVKKAEATEEYLYDYVSKYIASNNYQMDNTTIKYLLSRAGLDINNLTNELDKLMLFKYAEKKITSQDITELVDEQSDNPVYLLASHLLKNETAEAIKLYNDFLKKGLEPSQLIPTIASQIRLLFEVKRLHNKGKSNDEIAKILEFKNSYRVKYLLNDSYYYSEDDLLNYLNVLAGLDKKIKLSLVDSKIALELFIAKKDM